MNLAERLTEELRHIAEEGLYKHERIITTPQGACVTVSGGQEVVNFCANNYLGLADDPGVIEAAKTALDSHGFGLASVRFICGTQDLHRRLEETIAAYFRTDDAILYSSCFDANGGLFETLLDEHDVIISDALNHASIIDGVRLSRAQRARYAHSDMDELEAALCAAAGARTRLIATDGVFSMDGDVARLGDIVALARRHDAAVMVDDSHATGVIGPTGRGSAEHCGVHEGVDIFTSTLGKALGGASGGFTTASEQVVAMLRQRSRPYLFSNTLAPPIVAAALHAFGLLEGGGERRERLLRNARHFRDAMTAAGFELKPGSHPIVPVMLYDAKLAQAMATDLLRAGIYVIGFSYPVVPKGQARIRVQLSALHETVHIERAVEAFTAAGRKHGVLAG